MQPGVWYATMDDGTALPIVDITNPAFACVWTDEELRSIEAATLRSLRQAGKIPRFIHRWMAKRSIIMPGLMKAEGTFMSGMTTYLMRLTPEQIAHCGGGRIDRQLLQGLGPVSVRLRLRQVTQRLADEIRPILTLRRGPLHLVNIGGGPAIDSINALILLRDELREPSLRRRVRIHVLDIDQSGPGFGRRSLAALQAAGAPLAGLDISFEHSPCDWAETSILRDVLREAATDGAVVMASSEGGLFEYASDEIVAANLAVVMAEAPSDVVLVGSLAKDNEVLRVMREVGRSTLVLRDRESFGDLVGTLGWRLDAAGDRNPMYYVFSLKKDAA